MSIQDELKVDGLAAENRRLLREMERIRRGRADLVEAVYSAFASNVKAITYTPSKPVIDRRRDAQDETAIIVFSDLQLGQVTSTYNSDVAEERVHRYGDKIEKLVTLQRSDHPIRAGKLYLLGDLIEGELIFPSQPHQIDSSLYAQVALNGPRILTDFIRRMLGIFERLDIVSVPGNHGDVGGGSRKQYNPETNFDRILSTFVRQLLEASGEKRTTFRIPDGFGRSSFYAVDYVGDTGFMLWHGHQARRTSSSSHLPFYKLVLGWRGGAIPEPFRVSICGHHHTPTTLTVNSVRHFINGTFASDSDYAVERMASSSMAAQWLLFARSDKGLTAEYLVSLEG